MGFTAKALLPPIACFFALAYFTRNDVRNTVAGPLGAVIALWGFIALVVVFIYWAARIYQRATRDAPDGDRHR